ncbi:MAG: polysaccharide deacetylase family protein, partial [Lentisphaeria bacterium]|nr:polysaccharide deacetylase family protein [Lentisphaeria bacterium]
MTGGQIRELDSAGFEIANHTWNHPNLRQLSEPQIEQELSRLNDFL